MNPELLRTIYFALETVYPPIMKMDKTNLTELYGSVNQRYHYSTFALIQNGAVFSEQDISVCHILRDRIQFKEENLQADIQIYKEKVLDILKMTQAKYAIPVFFLQVVTLRGIWDCDKETNASEFIHQRFLKITPEELQVLDRPFAGIGLRFNSPKGEDTFDFRIEPWFRDLKYLFIELRSEFPLPINSLEVAEKRINQTYDYLFTKISTFIAQPEKPTM
ncbi:MAG: hypothetical protein N3A72_06830 [bacterium]|nr:hypothetical protein [bacterium]